MFRPAHVSVHTIGFRLGPLVAALVILSTFTVSYGDTEPATLGQRATAAATSTSMTTTSTSTAPMTVATVTTAVAWPPTPPGVYGTDVDIKEALDSAIRRFDSAGLTLPALRIYVSPHNECKGAAGAFYRDDPTNRVELCTANDFVVLHELAHAWVDENVTDATRQQFIDHMGLEVWNDNDVTWSERGVERAAQTIACGLLDPPLTRAETRCCPERIEHYELLTGARVRH